MRSRTLFYSSLGRLATVELMETEDHFAKFMLPLSQAVECLGGMLQRNETTDEARRRLVGLVRDLRGLAEAFTARTPYMMLWEWLYPTYCGVILRCAETLG